MCSYIERHDFPADKEVGQRTEHLYAEPHMQFIPLGQLETATESNNILRLWIKNSLCGYTCVIHEHVWLPAFTSQRGMSPTYYQALNNSSHVCMQPQTQVFFDHYCAVKARLVPKHSISKPNERLVLLITSPHPPTSFLFQHSPNEGSVSGYTRAFVSARPALSISLCAFVSASLSCLWLTALMCQWWHWNVSANKIKLQPGITPPALFTLYRLCWTLFTTAKQLICCFYPHDYANLPCLSICQCLWTPSACSMVKWCLYFLFKTNPM